MKTLPCIRHAFEINPGPRCAGNPVCLIRMVAFQISDMTCARCAGAVTKALKAVDRGALVRVDLATFTVEIEPHSATARQLSDAVKCAGYSPVAA